MIPVSRAAWLPFTLIILALAQACAAVTPAAPAAPTAASQPSPTAPPEVQVTDEPAPEEILEPDPTDLCPTPGDDTALYVDRENGFCMLYPADFSVDADEQRPEESLLLLGPRQSDQPKTQEEISVVMSLEYNGPADGLDSAAYARKWHEYFGEGAPYQEAAATIGGQPAVVLSDLPGFAAQRSAFVVANAVRYRISLSPQPEDMPELAEAASRGWETVTASLVFFPPENQRPVVRAEDVCPQETGDMRLYRRDLDGFCYLYPADFAPDPDWPGMVEGGPVLTEWPGLGDVQAYVNVGTFGHFEGQTPRQVLEPRMEQIDAASVQDASIGGYPAVTFRSLAGPWPSRQAMIVVDGDVYTIVGEPWDPEQFPEGAPFLDRLWESVTASLRFYDPWR